MADSRLPLFKNYLMEQNNTPRDIIITLPKETRWEDYEKELEAVKDGKEVMNFKVGSFPNQTSVGSKCYLAHQGVIKGWMEIVGLSEKEFTCSTTGREWKGKFIERSGKFHKIDPPIPMKGFQGFRYYKAD